MIGRLESRSTAQIVVHSVCEDLAPSRRGGGIYVSIGDKMRPVMW